jgi:dethiobiotin synthetase
VGQSAWCKELNTRGFFITGTDTGVGKTIITAALIKIAQMRGVRACGMKPIETGCSKQKFKAKRSELKVQSRDITPADGIFLRSMGNTEESIDLITPVRFQSPLAPLPASGIEGSTVDLDKIKNAFAYLSKKYEVILVEGIGGLFVPIRRDYFVIDLAAACGLPLIVVAKPGLGTINHTMLTVQYALEKGIDVAGIIINYTRPPEGTPAEATNPDTLSQTSPVPVLGVFPYLGDFETATIEKAALHSMDIETIWKYLAG